MELYDQPSPFGTYIGRLLLEPLSDGRLMRVVQSYNFRSNDMTDWTVPANAHTDGASIPRPLWPLIGGPFEGKYRTAAVVHDFYCSARVRPWRAVHRMFYRAMLTVGVSERRAKLMFMAVFIAGPKWGEMDSHNTELLYGLNWSLAAGEGLLNAGIEEIESRLEAGKTDSIADVGRLANPRPPVLVPWLDLGPENLGTADLAGADLVGSNFRFSNLTAMNLAGADLTRSDMTGADLTGANLTNAVLIDADLTGAALISADLTGADLTSARLSGANLEGALMSQEALVEAFGNERTRLPESAIRPRLWDSTIP